MDLSITPLQRFSSIARLVVLTFIAAFLFVCITHEGVSSRETKNGSTGKVNGLGDGAESFSVPIISYDIYDIQKSFEPLIGKVVLRKGAEAKTVSWAVLEAMQRMQLSVIEPPTQLDTLIPPDKPWKTDIAPLRPEDIQEHNSRFPQMALPKDHLYGIQYEGEYKIIENELRFKLKSLLHHRGFSGPYSLYSLKDYSGNFFFERAEVQIKECLRAASAR